MINNADLNRESIPFDGCIKKVDALLKDTLLTAPPIVRSQTRHLAGAGGKMIRAQSLLACSQDREGYVHPDAVKLAASVELLHLATLVHDDVIDDAATRRGQPTLQKLFGNRSAVICGDYLFCLSLRIAATVSRDREYFKLSMPDYMSRVCLGELSQNINNRNFDLSVYRYLKIISGKTAALFEAAFYAGAVICEDSKDEADKYSRLGRYVGMIFQLTDDCLDYEATQKKAKKPVLSDFEHGVITLPLIYAFQKDAGLKRQAKSEKLTKEQSFRAVSKTGGIDFTKSVSKKYFDKAKNIIERLNAGDNKKDALFAILEKAYKGLK